MYYKQHSRTIADMPEGRSCAIHYELYYFHEVKVQLQSSAQNKLETVGIHGLNMLVLGHNTPKQAYLVDTHWNSIGMFLPNL